MAEISVALFLWTSFSLRYMDLWITSWTTQPATKALSVSNQILFGVFLLFFVFLSQRSFSPALSTWASWVHFRNSLPVSNIPSASPEPSMCYLPGRQSWCSHSPGGRSPCEERKTEEPKKPSDSVFNCSERHPGPVFLNSFRNKCRVGVWTENDWKAAKHRAFAQMVTGRAGSFGKN